MLYPFDQMSDSSKMWIYQAERPFTDEEIVEIEKASRVFIENWQAHGHALKAAFKIEDKQFVILAVDEAHAPASGCSIDDSVTFIRNLEQKLDVGLLNRSNVALQIDGSVVIMPLKEIKSQIDGGKINRDTLVFNGFIDKMKDFRDSWTQPAAQSWMSRYFT